MTTLQTAIVRRRAQAALRLLAIGGLAVLLAGCYKTPKEAKNFPIDYRDRHPITLKEGSRTRRDLRRPQSRRADAKPARRRAVVRAAVETRRHQRHHRRRPARRANRSCRRRFHARNPFDPSRLRRAAPRGLCAHTTARRQRRSPASRSTIRNWSRTRVPAVSGRTISAPPPKRPTTKISRTGISAAPPSAISRP